MPRSQLHHVAWGDLRRTPDDRRPPAALVTGLALVAQLAWVGLCQQLGTATVVAGGGAWAIAVVAAWWLTPLAATGLAVVGFLVVDGFVEGRYGQLAWDGVTSAALLLAFALGCALSSASRAELGRFRTPQPPTSLPG